MSLLAPLYLLGALAVVAPIVFHLIRRTTRGEVPFSSLLFLSASPPRLTRRSRLDHWPLLLLRSTALILLAIAFARPFLRELSILNLGSGERSRVAVLIDASASMKRGDLWKQAQAAAADAIDATGPDDQIAVLAFDTGTRTAFGFGQSQALDASRRQAAARGVVAGLAPSWRGTDLGHALIDAVGAIEDVGDAAGKASRMRRRIVLVSDMAQGSKLDALGGFEWPSDVEIEWKRIGVSGSNAGIQRQSGPAEGEGTAEKDGGIRVRVANDPLSKRDTFALAWAGDPGPPTSVYVPPGESRVAKLPRPLASGSLRLRGDDFDYDDTLFVAAEPAEPATVLFVGPDAADDPAGLLYYLTRVFEGDGRRAITVEPRSPTAALTKPADRSLPMIVLAGETTAGNVDFLRSFVRDGGTLVAVPAAGRAEALAAVAEVPPFDVAEAPVKGDVLLGEIAFDHPLFAPFASPQFNDFTKIHFWKRRSWPSDALGPDARVLARFEGGDPAVVEKAAGKGRIVVLASGWTPADGQLARSSKFVPLMAALLDRGDATPEATDLRVGDPIPLSPDARSVRTPDGSDVPVEAGSASFAATESPGVYAIESAGRKTRLVAVNLDPAESKTAPLPIETLEQFGCRMASPTREAAERESRRQMQNAELEGRQKAWRWLILATIGVLILETGLAGWLGRPRPLPSSAEAPAT
ncbi:BatA domain-containing protein [Tundrisphaera sp. TA3]|uniref:BatA domain-containing protein n=1 Tax=Tundrisphaera sp. TA3 TaxID=3435775 RepID=UPI003EBD8035